MVTSSLNPDIFPITPDRSLGKGHGTGALGPSDTSDTGSDISGAPGLTDDPGLAFDTGNTSDLERSSPGHAAGPDVGDADLDSDTDSGGTGERAASGRDATAPDGADIDVDHIESIGRERTGQADEEVADFDLAHVETILAPEADVADADIEQDPDLVRTGRRTPPP